MSAPSRVSVTWEAAKARVLDGFESYDGVDGDGSVDALIAAGDALAANAERAEAALEDARDWYRDHVSDGFYDAQMWGDPFMRLSRNGTISDGVGGGANERA